MIITIYGNYIEIKRLLTRMLIEIPPNEMAFTV